MKTVPSLIASACLGLVVALPASAQEVGVSAAVNQSARGIRPGAAIRTIVIGDNVVYNERIETDPVGLLQILLADGTTFTVGPNSALSIDRFVYDPAAGTAEVTASLTKGVFRFIGGKASKTPGGVQLNTPVGTIGIRGAMATARIRGNSGEFALTFGKELTLDGPDVERQRVYKEGFSIIAAKSANGTVSTEVRRTPPGFAAEIQNALSPASGKSGGSPNSPTDGTVIASGIAVENSERLLANRNQFIRIDQVGSGIPSRAEEARRTGAEDTATRAVAEKLAAGALPERVPIPTPPPLDRPPTAVRVGLLTAGARYETINGDVVTDPGIYGLVGGSPETDTAVTLLQADGTTSASASTPQGRLTLPVYADQSFTRRSITQADGASLGGVPLLGLAYSDADGFAAYALGINGDRTNPVYALKGTPTPNLGVLQNGDVRTYAFTPDFLQELRVPFMRAGALNTDYAAASVTPFYVAEQQRGSANGSTRLFQSWLLIEGQGLGQESGIGVNVGDFFDDGGYQTSFSHRGSYRAGALSAPNAFTGGTSSLSGPDGGHHVFGQNAQNLVLGHDIRINDVFGDPSAYRGGTVDFGSLHVLSLTNETPIDQFASNAGATRLLGTGSNSTINGFASAIVEGRDANGVRFVSRATSRSDVGNVAIRFDRDARTIGGELEVGDEVRKTHVAFGAGINGNTRSGSSAFINDDMFGAHHNRDQSRTYAEDFDSSGSSVVRFSLVPDDSAKTYFVSGDAVPQTGLLPQGKMCACSFLEWGWWGTQIHAQAPSGTPGTEGLRQGVHLGNWVAGDVTTSAQLTGLTSTATATYQGHAIGTVATRNGSDIGRYVAAGDMSMTWNFGTSSGFMSIDNFDGRDLGSTDLTLTNVGASASFGGTLSQGTGPNDAAGNIDGAFVNGATIAQGVIGNMNVATPDGSWSATGIIAGAR